MRRRHRSIATITIALVTAGLLGPLGAPANAGSRHANDDGGSTGVQDRRTPNYAWQMFLATNHSRRAHGVPRLDRNRALSELAERHARAMARQGRLFHTRDVSIYLDKVKSWSRWGENIGWTSGDVADLERAFMHSSEHRANILSRAFHHVAVGAVRRNGKIWVSLFFYG
jgi:uncharacterized protein YkwD